MKKTETALPDVVLLEPRVFGDDRGFFFEAWNAQTFRDIDLDRTFVQENHSRSAKGVLRGLHYQVQQPQGKLVRVVSGRLYDVAVDIRKSSPTFGQWVGYELSAENKRMLWIPEGFAHGFLALEDGTELLYKCTDHYAPDHERSILWNDRDLRIDWPLGDIEAPILSRKDEAGQTLSDADLFE
ncbi:MAG: dTDP-4-dehydrorhamnose 3,5-epimerase [Alphaproteobacteria bacterium]